MLNRPYGGTTAEGRMPVVGAPASGFSGNPGRTGMLAKPPMGVSVGAPGGGSTGMPGDFKPPIGIQRKVDAGGFKNFDLPPGIERQKARQAERQGARQAERKSARQAERGIGMKMGQQSISKMPMGRLAQLKSYRKSNPEGFEANRKRVKSKVT